MVTTEEKVRLVSDPNSAYFRNASRLIREQLEKAKEEEKVKRNKSRIHLDTGLDSQSVAFLEEYFGYTVEARPCGVAYHDPLLVGFSRCMMKRVLDAKYWRSEEVVIIDGDVRQIVTRHAYWMHVCRLSRGALDSANYAEQDDFVRRTVGSKNESMAEVAAALLPQLESGCGSNVCTDAVSCKKIVDTVVFDPVRLCPSARLVAETLKNHAATRAKGWFFFNRSMLRNCIGTLCGGKFRYFVDREKGLCTIYSEHTSIPFYVCNMSDVISLLTNRTFIVDGQQFVVEFHGSDEDVMNWVVSRSEEIVPNVEHIAIPLWGDQVKEKMVMVSLLAHVPGYEEQGPQPVVFTTSESLVEKVIARLISMEISKITDVAARETVRMYSDQYMELGGFVRLPGPVDGMLFEFIARACCRRARIAKLSAVVEHSAMTQGSGLLDKALYGSFSEGVLSLMSSTGQSFWNVVKAPLEIWKTMMKNQTWDVAIEREQDYQMLRWDWEPSVRGLSPLGTLPALWVGRYVDDIGKTFVRQAWVWYKSRGNLENSTYMEHIQVREVAPVNKVLGQDREEMAQKLDVAYAANSSTVPVREVEEYTEKVKPILTPSRSIDDPYSVMQENYDENFPGVALCDYADRTYMACSEDRAYNNNVINMRVAGFEEPPRNMEVWETVLRCGVSGPRPACAFETNMAFGKRVGGAPNYQMPLNIEAECANVFDMFQMACLRPGWKELVKDRVAHGMWQPRTSSVRDVLGKMKPSGVGKIKAENFNLADILMVEYEAMVKRQPKDKLDVSTAFEHSACQTIMFQTSKSTNAFFSSIMSEVNDCLDDALVSHVSINMRRDKEDAEKVWNGAKNRWNADGTGCVIDVDISQCDKSQTEFTLYLYIYILRQFGLPDDLYEYFLLLLGKKKATAWDTHLMSEFIWQVVSGLFYTIAVNSYIVGMATVRSLELTREQIGCMLVSGDDVMVCTRVKKDLQVASVCFASLFNFEVKLFETKQPYWCGRYVVTIDGYDFFLKDPERIFSMLARYQKGSYNVDEAFEAFVDDTKAYQWQECVEAIAEVARVRNGRNVSWLRMAQGIATVRRSPTLFAARLRGKRVLSL